MNRGNSDSFVTFHQVDPEDKAAMTVIRAAVEPIDLPKDRVID